MYWRRPLTRLELAIYVTIAAILAAVLLDRLERLAEAAEKAVVEATLLRLQSALQIQLALAPLKGTPIDVERWPKGNPFELAQMTPPNYLGELDAPEVASLQKGNWFFDRARGEIVYLPGRARYFSGGVDSVPAVRYRLDAGMPVGASFPQAKFIATAAYQWDP